MFMSVVAAGLLTLASGTGDTPIVPLDHTTVEAFIATPDAVSLCSDIGTISSQVDQLGVLMGGDASFVFTMAVSYWQDMAEQGIGPSAAMTVEGESLFRAWVYDCAGRVDPSTSEGAVRPAGFARPRPETVSGCSLSVNHTGADTVTLRCTTGYGWTQIEGYCYLFDGELHHFQSAWNYKYPDRTLTYSVRCPSQWPQLYSAWIDYTK